MKFGCYLFHAFAWTDDEFWAVHEVPDENRFIQFRFKHDPPDMIHIENSVKVVFVIDHWEKISAGFGNHANQIPQRGIQPDRAKIGFDQFIRL